MVRNSKIYTPDRVERLSNCEIIVFGSDLEGNHTGGVAKLAHERFGAEWGVGDGPTGRCYAIPTMFESRDEIWPYVEKFIEYAKAHPMNRFLLTRVGCGNAGFRDEDIAILFEEIQDIPNITYPRKWRSVFFAGLVLGTKIPRAKDDAPAIVCDTSLKELCQKHLYEIGADNNRFLPDIIIRYVAENKKFGYAHFGEFFFFADEFYIWEKDDKYAEDHNQDVVWAVFGDECEGRGYARRVIFAGVKTDLKDTNGESIYSGDVLKLETSKDNTSYYAVGALADHQGGGCYCFLREKYMFSLYECEEKNYKMTRVGTVFYQLNPCVTLDVNQRVVDFNECGNTEEDIQAKLTMAKYTPNYEQEFWKYSALELLGAEYDWR